MERFQSGIFRRIVIIHMLQALVLSITGIVDSAIVGQFWEAEGLAGMKLAVPVLITWLLGRQWGMQGIYAAFAVHEVVLTVFLALMQVIRRRNGVTLSDDAALGNMIAELRGSINTMEQVTEASDKVISLCRKYGVDNRQAFNVGLCLEELAANSLLHGFRDNREKYVEYRFIIIGRWLILRLRDNGRPFDLTERYKLLDPDDPVSGMGLRIVFSAAENVNYSHAFDLNNVCIRVLKQSRHQNLSE